MSINDFPLGLATDQAFCNRVAERDYLKSNILSCTNTLLVAPRRYGKTSLALKVLKDSKVPHIHIDFFGITTIYEIQQLIINGVNELIRQIRPKSKRALNILKEIINNLNLTANVDGLELSIALPKLSQRPAETVKDILMSLEKIAAQQNIQVCVLFDEFQEILNIKESIAIEGAIRHVAQQTQHTSCIFAGSNRHLMAVIFEDSNRPFYNLCDRLTIGRISEQDYLKFIKKRSLKRWREALAEKSIEVILHLTERHPYYVNVLCSKLWRIDKLPSTKVVSETWRHYCAIEKSKVANDIDTLSINQRKMLIAIARSVDDVKEPTSQEFLSQVSISGSSALQSLDVLIRRDFIYQTEDGVYHVLDPLIKSVINLSV